MLRLLLRCVLTYNRTLRALLGASLAFQKLRFPIEVWFNDQQATLGLWMGVASQGVRNLWPTPKLFLRACGAYAGCYARRAQDFAVCALFCYLSGFSEGNRPVVGDNPPFIAANRAFAWEFRPFAWEFRPFAWEFRPFG